MARSRPEVVICTYRVGKGKEAAFLRLLSRHWPLLRRLRMVTAEPPRTYRGRDEAKRTVVVDIFTWRDTRAVEAAHEDPEVLQVWEAMDACLEERLGRPKWEFPHFEPVRLRLARK